MVLEHVKVVNMFTVFLMTHHESYQCSRSSISLHLGAIPKQSGNGLKEIGITAGTAQVQKIVLLGTARILRKVLEI